jgi:predicted nucleic acid-binding protein
MVLVDANVLLDVLTDDSDWRLWSEEQLLKEVENDELAINPIIYAELAPAYRTAAELERALRGWTLRRLSLPYEAGFLAGQTFVRYRREGGQRRSPLPDFYIGAHAQTDRLRLLTRDAARYRTYFPRVILVAPPSAAPL